MSAVGFIEKRSSNNPLSDSEVAAKIIGRLSQTPNGGSFSHRNGDEELDFNGVSFGEILGSLSARGLLHPQTAKEGVGPEYIKGFDGTIDPLRFLEASRTSVPTRALPGGSTTSDSSPFGDDHAIEVPNAKIDIHRRRGPLTASEVKFLILVGRGLPTSYATDLMVLGKRTGDFHLAGGFNAIKDLIESETGIRPKRLSRMRAIMFALRRGWIDPRELIDPEFPVPPKVNMTPMEVEVASRMILGFSSKEIALDLKRSDPKGEYSKRTVDFHIKDLFDKFSFGRVNVNNKLKLLQALIHQNHHYGLADQPRSTRRIYLSFPELGAPPRVGAALALPGGSL